MKILVVLAISALSLTAYAGTHKVENLDKVEATQSLCSDQSFVDVGIEGKLKLGFNEACLCCAESFQKICCDDCYGNRSPDIESSEGRSANPIPDLNLDATS